MMGIAPIFFWFAHLCLRLDCVTSVMRGSSGDDGAGRAYRSFRNLAFRTLCCPVSAKVWKATTRDYSASGRFDRNHP